MIRSLLAGAAAVALWVWVAPVLAVEPLTGPHYDKWMILDAEREPMEFTVGYFAACAQERLATVVAGGARPPPGRRVRGEEQDGVFVVTVPGTNEDIVFYFVPAESEVRLPGARPNHHRADGGPPRDG